MVYALLLFLLLLFYTLFLHPLLLLIRCLFDSAVSVGLKVVVFLGSFLLWPLPSYAYGAFVKKGLFSRIILGLLILFMAMGLIALAIGSMAGGTKILQNAFESYSGVIQDKLGIQVKDYVDLDLKKEFEPEPEFKGRNTYTKDDVQVFESGRNARDFSEPPQPSPIMNDEKVEAVIASPALYAACIEAASNPKLSKESCSCVGNGFENNPALQPILGEKTAAEKSAIENQAIQIYGSIANQDAAAMQAIKSQIQTDMIMKDAVLVVMTLTKSCTPPPVAVPNVPEAVTAPE